MSKRVTHKFTYLGPTAIDPRDAEIDKLKADLLLLAKYASDVWRYDDIDVMAARKLRDRILGEGK